MPEAKEDCERVINYGLPLAEQLLLQHGEFLPFGIAMRPNSEIVCLGAVDSRSYQPVSTSQTELMHSLRNAFIAGARRQEYITTALFYEARITFPGGAEPKDAVIISVHHRDGYAATVLFPYSLDGGDVLFESPHAQAADFDVFSAD